MQRVAPGVATIKRPSVGNAQSGDPTRRLRDRDATNIEHLLHGGRNSGSGVSSRGAPRDQSWSRPKSLPELSRENAGDSDKNLESRCRGRVWSRAFMPAEGMGPCLRKRSEGASIRLWCESGQGEGSFRIGKRAGEAPAAAVRPEWLRGPWPLELASPAKADLVQPIMDRRQIAKRHRTVGLAPEELLARIEHEE